MQCRLGGFVVTVYDRSLHLHGYLNAPRRIARRIASCVYPCQLEPGGKNGGSIKAFRLAILHGLSAYMDRAGNLGLGAHPLAPRPTTLAGSRGHCTTALGLLARAPVGIP